MRRGIASKRVSVRLRITSLSYCPRRAWFTLMLATSCHPIGRPFIRTLRSRTMEPKILQIAPATDFRVGDRSFKRKLLARCSSEFSGVPWRKYFIIREHNVSRRNIKRPSTISRQTVRRCLCGHRRIQAAATVDGVELHSGTRWRAGPADQYRWINEVAFHASGNQKHGVYPIYPRSWAMRVWDSLSNPVIQQLYGRALFLETDLRTIADAFSSFPCWMSPTCHLLWGRGRNRSLQKRLQQTKVAIEASKLEDETNSERTRLSSGQ